MQTAYDIFLIAPLGIGVVDQSAGGSLVVAHFTGREIKNCLEYFLVGQSEPARPVFSARVGHAVPLRPFSAALRRRDGDRVRRSGPRLSRHRHLGRVEELYSLACNLYLGLMLASIPKKTNGALAFAPKQKDGTPLGSRADALPTEQSGPYMLPPKGTIDQRRGRARSERRRRTEIKEWQAIMNYLKSLPTKNAQGVTVLAMDEHMQEN